MWLVMDESSSIIILYSVGMSIMPAFGSLYPNILVHIHGKTGHPVQTVLQSATVHMSLKSIYVVFYCMHLYKLAL